MQNALFVGVSAQTALARELDVIANNMANVSTTGFKARSARFQEYLMPVASADSFQRTDRRLSYVIDQGTPLDLTQGPVEPDSNPMHVALRGDAFLAVQTPQGLRYTRNGAFELDATGNLVTSDGHAVQGDGGPITIGQQETGLAIAPDGTISTNLGIRGRAAPRHLRQRSGAEVGGCQPVLVRGARPARGPRCPSGARRAGALQREAGGRNDPADGREPHLLDGLERDLAPRRPARHGDPPSRRRRLTPRL
ncbi:flagellar basal-body rod protein FlgF [Methylorubrum pseudosasae]|nr:flagellar basal-body rod protein FlgF [Methylorubrum pseudosasae]